LKERVSLNSFKKEVREEHMSTLPFKQIDVFGKANDGFSSLHLRSFAPALGVAEDEDPVCGSGNAAVAACA